MIDNVTWIASQLLLGVVAFPTGYLISTKLIRQPLNDANAFVAMVVHTILGIAAISLITFLVGMLSLSLAIAVVLITSAIGTFLIVKSWRNHFNKKNVKNVIAVNAFPFALILFTFVVIGMVSLAWKWVPGGDPFTHELWTALILYHDRVPLDHLPLNNLSIYFPYGVHASSAFVAKLLGVFPGEGVLMFSSFVMAMLPLLVFAFVQSKTKSVVLSTLAFSAMFIIHPISTAPRFLELWAFGYFFNGVYPAIAGVLFGILFFLFQSARIQGAKKSLLLDRATIFLLAAIASVYHPLIPALIVSILAVFTAKKILPYKYTVLIIAVSIVVVSASFYMDDNIINNALFSHRAEAYHVSIDVLITSYSFIVVAISSAFAIYNLIGRKSITLSTLFLSVAFPLIISAMLPQMLYANTLGTFFLSNRMLSLVYAFAWIYLAISLYQIKDSFATRIFNPDILYALRTKATSSIIGKGLAVLFILLLFSSVYAKYLSGEFIRIQGHFNGSVLTDGEYQIGSFLAVNTNANDVILADPTDSSIHLLGFKTMNSVLNFPLVIGRDNQTRAAELLYVFQYPEDYEQIHYLLKKYDVRYVVVTEFQGYYDYWTVQRGEKGEFIESAKYTFKPYPPDRYVEIFISNPSLELLYKYGNSAVFKVTD